MHPVTVDAFSSVPFGGNPAGVAVFDDKLPEEAEMRRIAAKWDIAKRPLYCRSAGTGSVYAILRRLRRCRCAGMPR